MAVTKKWGGNLTPKLRAIQSTCQLTDQLPPLALVATPCGPGAGAGSTMQHCVTMITPRGWLRVRVYSGTHSYSLRPPTKKIYATAYALEPRQKYRSYSLHPTIPQQLQSTP